MPLRIYSCDQRSLGWFSVRSATPVTASAIGTILRNPNTKTYKDLVYEKAYQGSKSPNNVPALDHGITCEHFALERLRKRYKIYDIGFVTNSKYPLIGVSPDGVIRDYKGKPALLEIKCPYSREITGEIPKDYYHQMQLQMLICEIPRCLYAEYQFDPKTYEYRDSQLQLVELDKNWWPKHKEKIQEFIEDIQHLQTSEGDSLITMLETGVDTSRTRSPSLKKRKVKCLLDDL